MRYLVQLLLLLTMIGSASALTPLPDRSLALFAGEWTGIAEYGSYCYVKLDTEGQGLVLIDGGTGDWKGARMQWHNQQQKLQVDKIIPLPASPQQRIKPLEKFLFSVGFNQSLSLTWSAQFGACQLQRTEAAARQLTRARATVDAVTPGQVKR